MREKNPMKIKTITLAILVGALGYQACFAQGVSDSDVYNYVRNTWNVASLSDDTILAWLDQPPTDFTYGGQIPYKKLIGALIETPRIIDDINKGDYRAAGKEALDYGQGVLFDAEMEQLGVSAISAPAAAAAWPIDYVLETFVNDVKRIEFNVQCERYFAARSQYNSYDEVMTAIGEGLVQADRNIVQAGGFIVTDDGWLYSENGLVSDVHG